MPLYLCMRGILVRLVVVQEITFEGKCNNPKCTKLMQYLEIATVSGCGGQQCPWPPMF